MGDERLVIEVIDIIYIYNKYIYVYNLYCIYIYIY